MLKSRNIIKIIKKDVKGKKTEVMESTEKTP